MNNRLVQGASGLIATPQFHMRCQQFVGHSNLIATPSLPSCSGRITEATVSSSTLLQCRPSLLQQQIRHGCQMTAKRKSQVQPVLAVSVSSSLPQPEELPLRPETAAAGLAAIPHWFSSLYRFSRPHTMLGTAISVISVSMLALGSVGWTQSATTALAQALSSALLMNICIVGINQLYDIEIDKVNKPYLPLAAGDFTPATGTAIVVFTGAAALIIGVAAASPPLLVTLAGSLLLGIAYSTDLPFLRWKRHPVAAASCILAVRAVLVQLGFFFHMQAAQGAGALALTRPVVFATAFMLIFSIVIALFKDIPDVAGDAGAGMKTLSVRLGVRPVFWTCIALLEAAYLGAIVVGLLSDVVWRRWATVAAHTCVGAFVFLRAKNTDLSSSKSIYACYMDVWKAFYLEYLFLPLFR